MLTISEFILNFVVESAWQVTVMLAIAALASRALKSGPARYRHVLWVVALAACLIVPLLTPTRWVLPSVANSQKPLNVAQVVTDSTFSGFCEFATDRKSTRLN